MEIPSTLTYAVLAIACFNFLIMITVIVIGFLVYRKVTDLLQEVKNVLRMAQGVLANAEVATRRIGSGAETAQRIVGQVEEAVSGLMPPIALIGSSVRSVRTSNLKMKVLGMAAGLALRYVLNRITRRS
ncbi:MAG: hypothetical protein RMJ43_11190 [Chloroherpetonaceae bacterium]|nr:hypothetical protein [Chthonomonadaceae bacterium]MDW8208394.1 hypothetical protein [Chloroherpetonaceae bacterium]